MAMSLKGILGDARPGQPQEDAYTTPNISLRGLNVGGQYPEGEISTGSLPLALHHVIPWNLLRAFWNAMQSNNYWTPMAVYGSMVGVAQATMTGFTTGMKQSKFGDPIDLDEKICWAPWNLVRGPRKRSDDPGEELDDMQSSYGAAANNQRIKFLIARGTEMQRLVAAMPREDAVRDLVESMKRTLNRKRIMEFDRNIWRVGSDSPDFVSANRDAFAVEPLWHIRGRST
jgi:hypothetical protein